MKFWLFPLLVWLSGSLVMRAQGDSLCPVPESVRKAFAELHPHAKEIFWEPWNTGFRASFFENGKSQEFLFSSQGFWICAYTYLDWDELPNAVRNALDRRFPGSDPPMVLYQVNNPDNSVRFRANFEIREGLLELTLDSGGKILAERLEAALIQNH